jgi:pyruvate dehydrogenase E2 component (dihydrolipoamide acetyltransferase)
VGKGETAPVDSILAILGSKEENVAEILAAETTPAPIEEAPAPVAAPAPAPVAATAAPTPAPAAVAAPVAVATPSNGRVKASPLAKKLAEDRGISLDSVAGSGDAGRIVKRDIENYVAPAPRGASGPVGVESFTEEPVSQMRKTIARRLGESKFSAPHFYLTIDIDMDNAIAARKAINAVGDVKISFNDFVVKAAAVALRRHPKVNSSWLGESIRYNEHVNIGVAVAVDEGLLVPVVRFADSKSLSQIGDEVKELAGRAKSKKLQPHEWEGNTFTISNLGMYGITEFTAIINSPDSCIMAIGGIKQTPVVKNGEVVPGNVMKVTLSCDHRVVDGATGSEFLNTFKKMLENPVMMIA